MARIGACAFCGAHGELDQEHFIGKRFRKLFTVKSHPGYAQKIMPFDAPSSPPTQQERRARSPWRLTVQVGKNCCNNAWMRELDGAVAPFLNGVLTSEPGLFSD